MIHSRSFKSLLMGTFLFAFLLAFEIIVTNRNEKGIVKFEDNTVVVHALGAVDGIAGLNCLEGFEESYAKGNKFFETDIAESSDGHLILVHDFSVTKQFEDTYNPTLQEFLDTPICGKYTPLSFKQFIDIVYEMDDVYIVTDFKTDESEDTYHLLNKVMEELREEHKEDIIDRFVVQFYHESELEEFKKIGKFGQYVLTLYKTDFEGDKEEFDSICGFCEENGVKSIVMQKRYWDSEMSQIAGKHGILLYPHTENNLSLVKQKIDGGAGGIYSDSLSLDDYNRLKEIKNRWYENGKIIYPIEKIDTNELEELYKQGERNFYFTNAEELVSFDIVSFLKAHDDTFVIVDFNDKIIDSIRQKIGADEKKLFNHLVVCVYDFGQTSYFSENNMDWCDFIYMAGGFVDEHKEYGFEESLKQSFKTGIASIALDDYLWEDSYIDIRQGYSDVNVYLYSGQFK